jgi:hypothetical protein
MTFNACWGRHSAYAGVRPSPPLLARFPTVSHPSFSFLRCYSVAILTLLVIPAYLCMAYLHVCGASCYQYSFRRHSYSRSGPVLHMSSIPIVSRLFPGWGAIGSLDMSWCYFCGDGRLRVRPVVLVPFWGPHLPSSLPIAAVELLCRGLQPRMGNLDLLLFLCGLLVALSIHDGQAV